MHFDIEFKLCSNPAKAIVMIDIQALDMFVREEFDSSVTLPIPAFGDNAFVNMQFGPDSNKTKIDFQLSLSIAGYPVMTILKRQMDYPECNAFSIWFKSLTTGSLVAIAAGIVLVAMFVLWVCVCCCRHRSHSDSQLVSTVITNRGIYLTYPVAKHNRQFCLLDNLEQQTE